MSALERMLRNVDSYFPRFKRRLRKVVCKYTYEHNWTNYLNFAIHCSHLGEVRILSKPPPAPTPQVPPHPTPRARPPPCLSTRENVHMKTSIKLNLFLLNVFILNTNDIEFLLISIRLPGGPSSTTPVSQKTVWVVLRPHATPAPSTHRPHS